MEKVTVTAKVQILPSEEQKPLLDQTMDAYRRACNMVSGYIMQNQTLELRKLQTALYNDIRRQLGLKAQMTQSVFRTVVARYKTIRTAEHRWIEPSFKRPQYDLVWNRDYSLSKDRFSVNTLVGRLKLPFCIAGMEKYFDPAVYQFGGAKLVKKHGKYFLHISVASEVEACTTEDIRNVVGIDRGINFVVTTYDSDGKTGFVSGRAIKQRRGHFSELRKELQQRQTPSARRRLKTIGHRENRWIQDVNHQVSKALVANAPMHTLFVLEDLSNARAASERVRRKDRYVTVSWAFYDLEQKLRYKAKLARSMVITVDPKHTSQRCPICGHTEPANRNRRKHVLFCKRCGYRTNDDRAAAMNLHRMGMDYLANSRVPDAVTA